MIMKMIFVLFTMNVFVKRGGWTITTTKKWSFVCLFVLVRVVSTLFDNSSSSVCVRVIFFCNCSSIGEMTPRLTPERPKRERASSTKSQTDVEEGFLFVCYYLQFFCFSSAIFVSRLWFVSCEPEISPRFSYSLLFYFFCFLQKKRRSVFCLFCFAFCLLLLLFQSIFKLLIIIFNFTYFLLLLLFCF